VSYFEAPLIGTYAPPAVNFVKGSGCWLEDDTGKKYLDCLAGIAVVSVGHANPSVNAAINDQLSKIGHVSNLFWTEPQALLAKKLNEITGYGKIFFANSGAEANECAVKLVRKWAHQSFGDSTSKTKILCAENSFHGRTLGTLPATGQPAKWKGFAPLGQTNVHLPYNDLSAFENAVDEDVAAIWVEPIQGEGGIVPGEKEFLSGLEKICRDKGLLFVLDEVQSGIGRTGKWWGFQNFGLKPDIFTSAKGLGNGMPIGACIASDQVAEVFKPGDHGTTFGGGPVPCRAALAAIDYIEENDLMTKAVSAEKLFRERLSDKAGITGLRGIGLMLGVMLESEIAKKVEKACFEAGMIVNAVRPNVVRLTPPLIISDSEIEQACEILVKAVAEQG